MLHRHTAHERQNRLFVRHCCAHSCHTSEVTVQPLNPVCCVNHRLFLRSIVQISYVRFVVGIVPHQFEGSVVFAPTVTHFLPFGPCHLDSVVVLSGAEDVSKISCKSTLVAVVDLGEQIAFQISYTALERGAGKLFLDNSVKTLYTIGYLSHIFSTPLSLSVSNISPHLVVLSVGMLKMPRNSRLPSPVTANAT